MKKVRNGKAGEVTAEIFETWFPNEPELILMDFLHSGWNVLFFMVPITENRVTEMILSHITREYAQKLLDEFKILRGKSD